MYELHAYWSIIINANKSILIDAPDPSDQWLGIDSIKLLFIFNSFPFDLTNLHVNCDPSINSVESNLLGTSLSRAAIAFTWTLIK